ncbi:hypothetical protein OESDEN_14199 [Oesophagostomum dentatum]|uniref:Uncharacterized protein n=1 Tax=Oesophagostomum dentatum TaxID=61180 RepID=A0A0B1SRD4_OESDE|nr:hypothetical protein OESDEN_14199 [Oesophagostomum dentatum]
MPKISLIRAQSSNRLLNKLKPACLHQRSRISSVISPTCYDAMTDS